LSWDWKVKWWLYWLKPEPIFFSLAVSLVKSSVHLSQGIAHHSQSSCNVVCFSAVFRDEDSKIFAFISRRISACFPISMLRKVIFHYYILSSFSKFLPSQICVCDLNFLLWYSIMRCCLLVTNNHTLYFFNFCK